MATGDGIQKLLAAETAASQIVAEARKVRRGSGARRAATGAHARAPRRVHPRPSSRRAHMHSRTPAAYSPPQTTRSPRPPPNARRAPLAAPQAKQERLRQAKAEAEREIAAYRAEREGAYQKKLAEVGGHARGWGRGAAAGCARLGGCAARRAAGVQTAAWERRRPRRAAAGCASSPDTRDIHHAPPPARTRPDPKTTDSAAATSERLRKETDTAIQQVQKDVATSKAGVVDMLLKYSTTVVLN
jgi:hypothetical protein